MQSYEDTERKRDESLAGRAVSAADNYSIYIKNWLEQEVEALRPRVWDLIQKEDRPLRKAEYEQYLRALEEMYNYEIKEVNDLFMKAIEELREGVFDDGLDAHQYAQDALSSLERLARRVLRIRRHVADAIAEREGSEGEG